MERSSCFRSWKAIVDYDSTGTTVEIETKYILAIAGYLGNIKQVVERVLHAAQELLCVSRKHTFRFTHVR